MAGRLKRLNKLQSVLNVGARNEMEIAASVGSIFKQDFCFLVVLANVRFLSSSCCFCNLSRLK